ncbi:uncharacterized protein J3D65DRAFT_136275 [Phyllosticta citribraziliensis]|uniref:Secreted protein n=1 Tax=Phyllosticta citribraziliensis TaxID=989973 RepID=A0ABR1L6B7_9PEZI
MVDSLHHMIHLDSLHLWSSSSLLQALLVPAVQATCFWRQPWVCLPEQLQWTTSHDHTNRLPFSNSPTLRFSSSHPRARLGWTHDFFLQILSPRAFNVSRLASEPTYILHQLPDLTCRHGNAARTIITRASNSGASMVQSVPFLSCATHACYAPHT